MAHNDRFFRPSILAPTWVPTPHQVRILDQQTSESVNGDAGGTWNSTNPVIIGGAGVQIADAGGFTGGVTTKKYAPDGALLLGDNDYPVHLAPKTRTVLFPIRDSYFAFTDISKFPQEAYDQSVPGAFRSAYTPQYFLTNQILENRYFPMGATISELRLRFAVGVKPAAVPVNLPRFYFSTSAASENVFLPLPPSVNAYYNDGLPQDIVMVPAVITTVTAEDYYFSISQFTPGEMSVFYSVAITFTNIVDMRPGL